jgi:hypothetical protein
MKMVEEHYARYNPDHMKKAVKTVAKAVAVVKAKAEPLALRKGRKIRKEWQAAGAAAGSDIIVAYHVAIDQRQLVVAPQQC